VSGRVIYFANHAAEWNWLDYFEGYGAGAYTRPLFGLTLALPVGKGVRIGVA